MRARAHTIINIAQFSEILTSDQPVSQQVRVESRGDQPKEFVSYSEQRPTPRESLGTACCGPEELKGLPWYRCL